MFLSDILKESFPELRKHPLRPVKVAVIDSGIDSTHEVLRKKVAGAWEFQEENGIIVQKALPQNHNNDAAGHGTAVASIIAKIAPNVRILDFKVLKKELNAVIDRFDHVCLNELPEFEQCNPTSENLARIIYFELGSRLNDARIKVARVCVEETPGSKASYFE